MSIAFYISGHGFGHAARDIQVVNALARLDPAVRVVLRTSVPDWFLRTSLEPRVSIAPADVDTGVVQPDSVTVDEAETVTRAAAFYGTFPSRVAAERAWLLAVGARLVVGDIPPLACAAAAAAGMPAIALGNFTWDWIYGAYPAFDTQAPGVRRTIADAYAQATHAWRLPFAGGFGPMSGVEDVPLVARHARVARDETRRRLGLDDGARPVVLATFGGHGGGVPLGAAAAEGAWTIVATDYEVGARSSHHPNLRVIPADELRARGLTYTDLLSACDAVATKLGYGIVSECVANRVLLLYTLRGRFPEQEVFMRAMPAVLRSRLIAREDLLAGRWAESLDALLAQPEPAEQMETNGAEVVAARLLGVRQGRSSGSEVQPPRGGRPAGPV